MTDVTRRPAGTPDTERGTDSTLLAAHPQPGDTAPGTGAEQPAPAAGGTPTHHDGGRGAHHRLLPHDDTDRLTERLQHAVAGFVDAPRDAVQEADHVLRELAERFADAVTERRRILRRSWQTTDTAGTAGTVDTAAPGDGHHAAATDTEQLRLALRDYRELTDRLLRV